MIPIRERLKTFDLPTDSLEVMEAMMDIEDEYNITLSLTEIQSLHTKEDVIALVEEKIKI